jgi:hypothetical protein
MPSACLYFARKISIRQRRFSNSHKQRLTIRTASGKAITVIRGFKDMALMWGDENHQKTGFKLILFYPSFYKRNKNRISFSLKYMAIFISPDYDL